MEEYSTEVYKNHRFVAIYMARWTIWDASRSRQSC